MSKNIRMLKADIDKSNENADNISREIDRIKNAIGKRRHKDPKHWELFLGFNELKNIKKENSVETNKYSHRKGERSS